VSNSFSPVRNVSKASEVFERLRAAIWSGELQPGAQLRESHLARQMAVSQVPVREALLRLEHLGLVVRVPDRGTHVTDLSLEEILDRIEVRTHLEELAFCLAAKRMTPEIEAELRSRLNELEKSSRTRNHFKVAEADLRFHEAVWRASGNRVLEQALDRLCVSLYAFVSLKRHEASEKLSITSHRDLLAALLGGQAQAISRQIRSHLKPESIIPGSMRTGKRAPSV
jgi:DNA-binding GntR family transcriptional regulator